MSFDLNNILVHPVSKSRLDLKDGILRSTDNDDTFKIVKGIPVMLPKKANDTDTTFDYAEHYQTDAATFDYFADWHPVHREENRRLHEQILHQIPDDAQLILDVGCGGAWLAKEMIPRGKSVVSMDISTINPIRAKELVVSDRHFGLVADVFHLPFQNDSINCIVAAEIIEHVNDPELFTACLFNVLKPGGTSIITTPFNEFIQKSLCIHCNQLTPHNAHLHSFTEKSIADIAPKPAKRKKTKTFNSKFLVNLQLHLLLKFLPFGLWKLVDVFFHKLMPKRDLRLMLTITK